MSNTKGKKSRTKKSLAKSKAKNSLPKTDKKDTENIAKKTVQEEKQNILLDAEAIVDNVEDLGHEANEHKGKKEVVIKAPRIIPKEEEKKPKSKKKKDKAIEIERYNPQVKTGLSYDQVLKRQEEKLVNIVE